MKKMKTMAKLLVVIFLLSYSVVTAGNPRIIIVKVAATTDKIISDYVPVELAPATPKEALFIENDIEPAPLPAITRLAPITPKEATFEEVVYIPGNNKDLPDLLQKIAPETPKVADFEDSPVTDTLNDQLVPTTPKEAYFEE
jgi:hypothetical protein